MLDNNTKVKKIHWNVQTACNMPCGFCYLWRKPESFHLSTSVAKELIRQAVDCNVEWFVFGGGDPLLREDFQDLLEFAHDSGLKLDLQTNAIRLPDLNVEAILKKLDRMGLSLDGEDGPTHDGIRRYPGHFKIILDTLSLCDRYSVPTTVRTVVCRQNLGRLSHLAEILNQYSCIEKWSLRQFAPLGRGKVLKDQYEISDEEFACEVHHILEDTQSLSLKFPIVAITLDEMASCYCLLSEDGQVYGHPAAGGDYKAIGTFPQEPLKAILSKLDFSSAARSVRDAKAHPPIG